MILSSFLYFSFSYNPMAVDKNSEDDVSVHDWSKMTKVAENAGYREGINVGRESKFQESFDTGYQRGFQIGFDLGIYHGISRSIMNSPNTSKEAQLNGNTHALNKPTTGNCRICFDSDLLNKTIKDVTDLQEKHHQDVKSRLHSQYETDANNLKVNYNI